MDSFGFGVLGGIFASGTAKDEEAESRQKISTSSEAFADYTPPEIGGFQPTSLQKKTKKDNGLADVLLPVKISQILRNVGDGSQKFVLYNQSVGAICLIGQARSLEKLTSAAQFQLVDETGEIAVHYADEGFEAQQGDSVQVVGTVVLLTSDNFYVEAQHVLLLDDKSYNYEEVMSHHNVSVAYAAYCLDIGAKLKLLNKHSGKLSDLPGQAHALTTIGEIEEVELGKLYDHITDPVERLVIQYLKSRPENLAKRSDVIACLSTQYVGEFLEIRYVNNIQR
ncbi:uncharacterized protein BXIN_2045 [Babesia sp. Xinjiang]|uniref:uncharacterized protein n=1 Tax=Babesia sp. Xinjiang TaxID=462227 RepID=UPI000A25A6FE|nr:uncharacterized protein BXIN_2045 [Babesia sp. Xinjiang]ORM40540.1 hypothetical protein BXIN_2045 [Babesia sp. Xinjiang]